MIPVTDPAGLFHSVSDATRLRLLRLLGQQELNVQELVRITGLSQPRVSKHLAVLREHGWLSQRREGTFNWYRAVSAADFPAGPTLYEPVLAAADRVAEAEQDDRLLTAALAERSARARDFFSGIADRWDEIRGQFEHEDLKIGAVGALAPAGLRVLDIGTGTGAMLPAFGATGARIVALDHSPAMLRRAQARCRDEGLREVLYSVGDVTRLPFGDAVFDACNCSMVLHHVADPAAALAEMARTVRPGGRVMVTGFCRHDQEWMREELAHRWLGFDRAQIEESLRGAGLVPLRHLERRGGPAPLTAPVGSSPDRTEVNWPRVFLATAARESDSNRDGN